MTLVRLSLPVLPQARAPQTAVAHAQSSVGVEQYRETCSTDGRGSMKKLASFWRFVFIYAGRSAAGVELHGDRTNEQGRSRAVNIRIGACERRHGNG